MAPWLAQVLGVAFAGLAGVAAAAVSSGGLRASTAVVISPTPGAAPVVSAPQPTPRSTLKPTPALQYPTALGVPQPTPAPTVLLATVAAEPTTPLVPFTAGEAWRILAPDLDAAWGVDTPRTVDLLEAFLMRFPDDAAAREKLYAALVSRAEDFVRTGAPAEAAAQLRRAEQLLPERLEANIALAKINPAVVR